MSVNANSKIVVFGSDDPEVLKESESWLTQNPEDILCFPSVATEGLSVNGCVLSISSTVNASCFMSIPVTRKPMSLTAFPWGVYAATEDRMEMLGETNGLLPGWGENIFLGTKNWMAGGRCVVSSLKVNSLKKLALKQDMEVVLYNKLRMAHVLLSPALASKAFSALTHEKGIKLAMDKIANDLRAILLEKLAFEKIKRFDVEELPKDLFRI